MTKISRLTLILVALLIGSPAYAQQWDQVNGSMQVRSGPTAPLVIIDQTNVGQKIISLRSNGTEVCYATATAFSCTGGFTFPTSCTGTYTGPFTNGTTSTGQCINGSAITTTTSSAVTSTVPYVGPDGTALAPGFRFTSEATGWYLVAASTPALSIAGTAYHIYDNSNYYLRSNTAKINFGTADDVSLSRLAVDTLGLRRGTNTQTMRIGPEASDLYINKINGSNGNIMTFDATNLVFGVGNTARWYVEGSSGHLLAAGSYNIGDGAGNSPVNIFAEGDFAVAASGAYTFLSSTLLKAAANGKATFSTNNATSGLLSEQFTDNPTCATNCGTSPTLSGVDSSFTLTMGGTGSPASGFVVTFNGTWAAAPQCTASMGLTGMAVGKLPLTVVTTTTTITVVTNGTAPGNSDIYHFRCSLGQ